MGPLQLAFPLIFYARSAKAIPAVTLSLIAMLDAVVNPLWPMLILGEKPEASAYIGGAIIVVAVVLSVLGGRWIASK